MLVGWLFPATSYVYIANMHVQTRITKKQYIYIYGWRELTDDEQNLYLLFCVNVIYGQVKHGIFSYYFIYNEHFYLS